MECALSNDTLRACQEVSETFKFKNEYDSKSSVLSEIAWFAGSVARNLENKGLFVFTDSNYNDVLAFLKPRYTNLDVVKDGFVLGVAM